MTRCLQLKFAEVSVLWSDVPVVVEGVDLRTEILNGRGLLLIEVGGVLARRLQQVFGVVELVDKTASRIVSL